MKLRNKSKLVWNNGYITTKKGKLVCLPAEVWKELDTLEVEVERNFHSQQQPEPVQPEPFERLDEELKFGPVMVETPLLDEKIEESMDLMDEIDKRNCAERMIHEAKTRYPNLARWVIEDQFVDEGEFIGKLNLPLIGNPLELNKETFLAWVMSTFAEADDE